MRKANSAVLVISFAALMMSSVPAFGQGRGRGKDHGRGNEHARGRDHDRDRRAYFGEHDRDTIAAYYREHRDDLPPGLAKRQELPPGLARQLRRNGELPPGLRRDVVWFPPDLDRRLGPLPEGYRRCWVGNNVLVVNVRTFAIADVMLGFSLVVH